MPVASSSSSPDKAIDPMGDSPELVLLSLDWWLDPLKVWIGIPVLFTLPTSILVMDASFLDCGAHIGSLKTHGLWSSQDLKFHINVRELKAVLLHCSTFLPRIVTKKIC